MEQPLSQPIRPQQLQFPQPLQPQQLQAPQPMQQQLHFPSQPQQLQAPQPIQQQLLSPSWLQQAPQLQPIQQQQLQVPQAPQLLNAKHLYSLPEETMEDLKVPLIDAPVVALHFGTVMPKDGENALKDAMDRKNEATLKKVHEAMSLAIRSAAALSNFTRATTISADDLLQNPEVSPLDLMRTLLKMKRVAEFAANVSQESIQFCARAQVANIIIRRNIWLKHWKVDKLSKSNLATEKFSGRLLFGKSNLDKVLVETREKKKAMPSSSYRHERDTKHRTSHSFCGHYNAR
ncbi:UNVERIFIED_CONTAM: hypothetical protein K2H54_032569 [Gekko kuhli]